LAQKVNEPHPERIMSRSNNYSGGYSEDGFFFIKDMESFQL